MSIKIKSIINSRKVTLQLVNGTENGRKYFAYLVCTLDKIEEIEKAISEGEITLKDFGKVIYSSYGDKPSRKIEEEILFDFKRLFCKQ